MDRKAIAVAVREHEFDIIAGVILAAGLVLTRMHGYRLFDIMSGTFTVFVCLATFALVWNARRYFENGFFPVLGISLLFVAGSSLLHIFLHLTPAYGEAPPFLAWILSRALHAIWLLAAIICIHRRVSLAAVWLVNAALFGASIAIILWWQPFSGVAINVAPWISIETIAGISIAFALAAGYVMLHREQRGFSRETRRQLLWSVAIAALGEVLMVLTTKEQFASKAIGEGLKIISFYLIYKAVVEKGFREPHELIFRTLKLREQDLLQALNDLRESEERFKIIATNTPDHILVQDTDLRYQFVLNPQLGLTEKDMIGKTDFDILAKEDAAVVSQIKQGVLKTGKAQFLSIPLVSPHGGTQYFEGSYVPRHDSQGHIDGIIGYFRNVTERQKALEEIRSLSKFPSENPNPVLRLDEQGVVLYANEASAELLRYWKTAVGGIVPGDVRRTVAEALADGSRPTIETACNDVIFGLEMIPVVGMGYLNVYGKDITRRKQDERALSAHNEELSAANQELLATEEELRSTNEAIMASEAALRDSEIRYRRLFEAAQDGILILNADTGVIEGANPFIEDLLDYSREELIGKELWQIGLFKDIVASRDSFLELQQKEYVRYEDLPLQTKTGRRREVEFVSNVYPVGDRKVVQCNIRDITERKLAELALRENEEKYQALFDNMIDGVALHRILYDDTGRAVDYMIEDVNRAFEKITGLEATSAVGQKASMLYGTGTPPYLDIYARVAASGNPERFDTEFLPMEKCFSIAVFSPAKNYFTTVFEDITERKRAEEELWRSNAFNQSIIDSSRDCIKILDLEGRLQYMSPGGQLLLQIKDLNTCLNVPYEEFWRGTDRETVRTVIQNALQGNSGSFQGYCPTADGVPKWWDVSISPVLGDEGKPERLLAVSRDITERKQFEEELKESENRFRAIFEQAAVGVALLNTETGQFVRINHQYCSFLRYTMEEMLQKTFQDVTFEPDIQTNVDYNAQLRDGKLNSVTFEKRYVRKDGAVVWGSLTISPLWKLGDSPRTYLHIAIVQDITERKRFEEELRRSHEELEQRVEERTEELMKAHHQLETARRLSDIGTLASTVAHELRNPLAAIRMATYNIKRKAKMPELEKHLANIDAKVSDSDQIITNLLFYSRIRTVDYASVDISALLDESVETVAGRHRDKQVSYVKEYAGLAGITIDADQLLLKEVFDNLIDNALDAVPGQGGRVVLSADTHDPGVYVIRINDNGPGIDPALLPKVFEPFFSTKSKGTGLGLAVCR